MKKKIYGVVMIIVLCIVSVGAIGFLRYTMVGNLIIENVGLQVKGKTLNLDDMNYEALDELEKDLDQYELYLTGEAHGVQMSQRLMEYFTKFFVEKADVKYILLESGYATGELLNTYLETGDEAYLYSIIKEFKGSMAYTVDWLTYYKNIYNYNKTLPEDKKIQFVAIDVEHQRSLAVRYLQEVLPSKASPTQIEDVILGIKNWETSVDVDDTSIAEWNESFSRYEEIYKTYLGEKYFNFKFTLNNLTVNPKDSFARETAIINNFTTLYEVLPRGKYFGQWGSFHTALKQSEMTMAEPFATVVNRDYESLKNKVLSILYLYDDCQRIDINSTALHDIENTWINEKIVKHETPFIVKADAPFFKIKFALANRPAFSRNDLNQYLVVITDSPASKKIVE